MKSLLTKTYTHMRSHKEMYVNKKDTTDEVIEFSVGPNIHWSVEYKWGKRWKRVHINVHTYRYSFNKSPQS